ncbi:MAG: ribonuclease R [Saccharofermentans sp.]|nr:ribonuclease R [Saccharofermentans sp.]
MTRYERRTKYQNRSAMNMSFRQQARNGAMSFKDDDKPTCYAELAPRGPMQVKNQVIGLLVQNGDNGIVIPDPAFKETNFGMVDIDRNNLNGAPFKMTVVCEILNPTAGDRKFRGKIIEVLGDMGNNDVKMLTVLRQFGLSQTFPEDVLNEVKDLPVNPPEDVVEKEIENGRRDHRNLLTITIDGEEAKDLDDAISIEEVFDGTYKLYVHIADVSHYVRENTALDKEAQLRATSVYLVDRVIPMLPPKLSNGLCSLNPNVDRLTMTACMLIDDQGRTFDGDVYESVIKSDRRMSYKECYRLLTDPQEGDEKEYGEILPMLQAMKRLAATQKRLRDSRGAINFDFPETKVILNDDGSVKDVMPYPISFTNGIIEQFMICANEFVAERFAKMNYPFVYRIHEDPEALKMARFCNVARNFGAVGKLTGKITPLMITEYMETIKDDDARPMLDAVLLRSMAKARYAPDCMGHFGLASKFYCHFTSPIRRYPDLYIHRIIKSYLHNENKRRHFAGLVGNVSEHSSEMERNSVDAERASVDMKTAEYMKDKVGEHYEGKITSIIGAGLFVMLPNTIEGFIPFRSMRDHYIFDEKSYRAIGARSGNKLMIGQTVRIVVASVDTEINHIDFVFEEGAEGKAVNRHGGLNGSGGRRQPSLKKSQKKNIRLRKKGRR